MLEHKYKVAICEEVQGSNSGYIDETIVFNALYNLEPPKDRAQEKVMKIWAAKMFQEHESEIVDYVSDFHFPCAGCGWWFEVHERSTEYTDEEICKDCEDDYL